MIVALAELSQEKTAAVAVKIKLKRMGKIRAPYYRIIVADARTKRDGRAIEEIGKYHPKKDPSLIEVNSDRAQHWLSVGAQPTDPVRKLLEITGDWQKFKGLPGSEGTLKTAGPRADRQEAFAAALAETVKSDDGKPDKAARGGRKGSSEAGKGSSEAGKGSSEAGKGSGKSASARQAKDQAGTTAVAEAADAEPAAAAADATPAGQAAGESASQTGEDAAGPVAGQDSEA